MIKDLNKLFFYFYACTFVGMGDGMVGIYYVMPDLEGDELDYFRLAIFSVVGAIHIISTLFYLISERPIRRLFRKLEAGTQPQPDLRSRALKRAANLPFIHARISLIIWIAASLCLPAAFFYFGIDMPEYFTYYLVMGCVVTGALTTIFVYYVSEWYSRERILPAINPGVDLTRLKGVQRITVRFKLLVLFLGTGLVPILLLWGAGIYNPVGTDMLIYIGSACIISGTFQSLLVARSVVDPLEQTIEAMGKVEKGELNIRLPMLHTDELGELAAGFNRMAAGIAERDFVKDTFGKYVTRQVMEEILNGRLELGGEEREATVLFSDIRGFTALSEKMPPERLVAYLNQYLDVMVDVVFESGGTLDKFIGDAILASFGVPVHADDHTERAAKCALEMVRRLEGLNEQYIKNGEPEIDIGVAIATGKVVAGNIGSKKRMEYTVIGETVNTTNRIESLNKKFGTKILINDEAATRLKDSGYTLKPMPKVSVPGKEFEITVYEMSTGVSEN